jgi:hypothetical protein
VENLGEIWESVFDPSDMAELRRLARSGGPAFALDDALWVRIVFDVACAFHHRVLDRGQLVRSILPLYMAWVASFVERVSASSAAEVDAVLDGLCLAFEARKDYLLGRWRGRRMPDAAAAPPPGPAPATAQR